MSVRPMKLLAQKRSKSIGTRFFVAVGLIVLLLAIVRLVREQDFSPKVLWEHAVQVGTLLVAIWAAYQNELPKTIRVFSINNPLADDCDARGDACKLTFLAQCLGPHKEQMTLFLSAVTLDNHPQNQHPWPVTLEWGLEGSGSTTFGLQPLLLPNTFAVRIRLLGVPKEDFQRELKVTLRFKYLWPHSRALKELTTSLTVFVHLHAKDRT